MGLPVKLSDDLVKIARQEAHAADRSITAQIEHWAKLGRAVEAALGHDDVVVLKREGGNLDRAFPRPATRDSVRALLVRIAGAAERSELAQTLTRDRVVYQSDPTGSDLLMRIEPDGTRTLGRLERRRFVAARAPRRAGR